MPQRQHPLCSLQNAISQVCVMCIKSVALSYTPAITGFFMALMLFLQQAGQLPENSPKSVDQRCVHGVIEEGLILSALWFWSPA